LRRPPGIARRWRRCIDRVDGSLRGRRLAAGRNDGQPSHELLALLGHLAALALELILQRRQPVAGQLRLAQGRFVGLTGGRQLGRLAFQLRLAGPQCLRGSRDFLLRCDQRPALRVQLATIVRQRFPFAFNRGAALRQLITGPLQVGRCLVEAIAFRSQNRMLLTQLVALGGQRGLSGLDFDSTRMYEFLLPGQVGPARLSRGLPLGQRPGRLGVSADQHIQLGPSCIELRAVAVQRAKLFGDALLLGSALGFSIAQGRRRSAEFLAALTQLGLATGQRCLALRQRAPHMEQLRRLRLNLGSLLLHEAYLLGCVGGPRVEQAARPTEELQQLVGQQAQARHVDSAGHDRDGVSRIAAGGHIDERVRRGGFVRGGSTFRRNRTDVG